MRIGRSLGGALAILRYSPRQRIDRDTRSEAGLAESRAWLEARQIDLRTRTTRERPVNRPGSAR